MADDRLSRTLTAVMQEVRAWRAVEDPNPPAECYKDIDKAMRRSIKTIVTGAGYTPEEFVNLVEERTTARFVYELGIDEVLDVLPEVPFFEQEVAG